jgi:hypothetical protein
MNKTSFMCDNSSIFVAHVLIRRREQQTLAATEWLKMRVLFSEAVK